MGSLVVIQTRDFKQSQIQPQGTNDFKFIPYDIDSKLSKEAVKVHVLRERRRKRNPVRAQTQLHDGTSPQPRVMIWDSRRPSSKTNLCLADSYTSNCTTNSTSDRDGQMVAFTAPVPHASRNLHRRHGCLLFNQQALRDPVLEWMRNDFGVHSVARIDATNYLVDHYLSRCGSSHFPRELLSCYWQDSASFKAFLAHAATLLSMETGERPPVNIEQLMFEAVGEVRTRLGDSSQRQSNGTILAITILANVEEGRAQRKTAAWHWRGLKKLLQLRGDWDTLREHQDVYTMLLWREILTSNSPDFCFGHGIEEDPELQHCSEHIVSFFQNFADEVALSPCVKSDRVDAQRYLVDILNRDIKQRCIWTSSMKDRSEIACLTYVAMLTISASGSVDSRQMMQMIRLEVMERERWGAVTQDELLFVIVKCGNVEQQWRCQQLQQLSRCIYLTRSLNGRDRKTVRDLLSLYLGIGYGCDSKAQVLRAWRALSKKLLVEDGCCVSLGECHATGLEGCPNHIDD